MMGHPPNPEQDLLLELEAAACDQPLPTEVWRQFQGQVVDALGGQGSQNWPLIAVAVGYTQTDATEPQSPNVAEITAMLAAFFKKSETMFMGTELLSPTYGVWGHLLPVAVIHAHAVKVGDVDTAAAARDWLRFFWALIGACTAPDGSILSIGWRASPWQDPERDSTLLAWVRDVGLGADVSRWEAAAKRLGLGLGQSPVKAVALAVQASLAAGLAPAPIPAYRTMTPLHRLAGDGWLAVYLEANGNGNTPPRMAGLWSSGEVHYLPYNTVRIREKLDTGIVTRSGLGPGDPGVLTFNSSLYGVCGLGLPISVFSETVLGAPGVNAASGPGPVTTAPSPAPPPSPGEGPALDFAAMAAVVAALQVPHSQVALRDHLAEQVGQAPEAPERAGLAEALAGLGIGDGQDQAAGWKDVIAKLRG